MPNTDWSKLTKNQVGRYAEYFAKMEFASYCIEVYTTEVDDHGVDFVVKDKRERFSEIQVKSLRGTGYVYTHKKNFDINNKNLYLNLLLFEAGSLPDIYLIPAQAWASPNDVFVDRNYDKPGQTSKPEYGINVSNKNAEILDIFKFEDVIKDFLI